MISWTAVWALLRSPLGRVFCYSILLLGLFWYAQSWWDAQQQSWYKLGYDAAAQEAKAAAADKVLQDQQKIQAAAEETEKQIRAMTRTITQIREEIKNAKFACPDVGADALRLWNEPIEAANGVDMPVH